MIEDILVLSPTKNIEQKAIKLSTAHGINAKVVFCETNEVAIEWARYYASQGVKAFVSRGGMALAISEALGIHVIRIKVDIEDFSMAVKKATTYGSIVGVIINSHIEHLIPSISEEYHVNLIKIEVPPSGDFINAIETAVVQDHVEVLVCGIAPSRIAASMNIPYSTIESSENSIKLALYEAQSINVTKNLEVDTSFVSSITNSLPFGVVSIDLNGVVTYCNKYFLDLIGGNIQCIGMSFSSFFDNQISNIFINSTKTQVLIENIGNTKIVFYIKMISEGYIICCQKLSELQDDVLPLVKEQVSIKRSTAKYFFSDIYSVNKRLKDLIWQARIIAKVDSTVLITGESGTGKELFAQSIHNASNRAGKPFFAVNCAAITDSILESELFGYEEGAFTGARKGGKKGYFELADGGTLFLDEIGELSLQMQTKLLRVIQEKEIIRVGGEKTIPINTRIIAATLVNIPSKIEDGSFRPDLYYRINVLNINLPPLRERLDDIPGLYEKLGKSISKKLKLDYLPLKEEWAGVLKSYQWPGNVRELSNVIERIMIGNIITPVSEITIRSLIGGTETRLPQFMIEDVSNANSFTLEELEYQYIQKILEKHGGNKTLTCKELGISPATLWRRLKNENEK